MNVGTLLYTIFLSLDDTLLTRGPQRGDFFFSQFHYSYLVERYL